MEPLMGVLLFASAFLLGVAFGIIVADELRTA
jgi:hypothetical protein